MGCRGFRRSVGRVGTAYPLPARKRLAAGFGRVGCRGVQQGLPLLQRDRIGRHIGEHERARADDGIRADRHRAEHAGAGQDGHIIAEHRLRRARKDAERRAEIARFAVAAAERHALMERKPAACAHIAADNNAHGAANHKTGADHGAAVDVNGKAYPAATGQIVRQHAQAEACVERVRNVVMARGLPVRIGKDRREDAPARAFGRRADIGAQQLHEHDKTSIASGSFDGGKQQSACALRRRFLETGGFGRFQAARLMRGIPPERRGFNSAGRPRTAGRAAYPMRGIPPEPRGFSAAGRPRTAG